MSAGRIGSGLSLPSFVPGSSLGRHLGDVAVSFSSSSGGFNASSWNTLAASTAARLLMMRVACISYCSYTGTDDPGAAWQVLTEFGVGAPGSEVVVATLLTGGSFPGATGDLPGSDSANVVLSPMPDVPAGSRLAVRVQVQTSLGAGRTVTGASDAAVFPMDPLLVR